MDDGEINAKAAAALCGISLRTLQYWRKKHYGPPSFRIGGRLRYRQAEVLHWLSAQRDR